MNKGTKIGTAIVSSYLDMFFTAWIVMLLAGTLLGNAGHWTPAYWECFGGLYFTSVAIGYSTRRYYDSMKLAIRRDELDAPKNKKAVI